MASDRNKVISIFIQAVIAGVISGFLLSIGMSAFFGGNPGLSEAGNLAAMFGAGIGASYFSIAMTIYPVIKKGQREFDLEDFK